MEELSASDCSAGIKGFFLVSHMFKKLLVANRGEIACRILETAKRLGIATVAVYSEVDGNARHVALADEAVCIGPAPSAESYLDIDRIVAACVELEVDAVHPGYGFLSENARFVLALSEARITFVGPTVHAIEVMGDKIASRKLALSAGLPVVPGHDEALADVDDALNQASVIGYPVMLKASAGGGGKGMRIAMDEASCREGFERARSEAQSSFGDNRIFVEKFIAEPRHIEIQVLADQHGHCIHLNERECSIQRRHQKVIEEAPSPFLDHVSRQAMGEQALALVRAVDYCSAGTVEFIVEPSGDFYFLEMNTRLQVEHPVTEYITGLDLVEWMLRIAAGESLTLSQKDIGISGWSMEARLYAEDPSRGFLPSTGRLSRYQPPSAGRHVRVDSGVDEGDEIGIYYDPLLAKLITYGDSRNEAIARMRTALDQFRIDGVVTNRLALAALFEHERFLTGSLSTGFIDQTFPDGFGALVPSNEVRRRMVGLAAVLHHRLERRAVVNDIVSPGRWEYSVRLDDSREQVEVLETRQGYEVLLGCELMVIKTGWWPPQPVVAFEIDGAEFFAQFDCHEMGYRMQHGSILLSLRVLPMHVDALLDKMPTKISSELTNYVRSPMPGLLVSIAVRVGDSVNAGDEVAIIEAMKMENSLRVERDAVVAAVHASPGETLDVDQPIIEFEPDGE